MIYRLKTEILFILRVMFLSVSDSNNRGLKPEFRRDTMILSNRDCAPRQGRVV